MYTIEVKFGTEWVTLLESDNYKLAYSTFEFYASQAWMFGINEIVFLDFSIPEYPTSIDVTPDMIANLKARAVA